jgi:hypothetical protein
MIKTLMHGHSTKFIIGMTLIVTNYIVGWGGLAVFAYLGKKSKSKILYIAGTAVYALSWGMLALGVYLVGPEGVAMSKVILKTYRWPAVAVIAVIAAVTVVYFINKKKKGIETVPQADEKNRT